MRVAGYRVRVAALLSALIASSAVAADDNLIAPDHAHATHSRELISFDGVRLSYREVGAGTPTLVLIHGWLCDQSHWDRVLPHFSKRHRVITLDLAGHGRSGRQRADYTLDSFAADVEFVARVRPADPLVLVGHSMGGLVALAAAKRLQHRVRLIVAVDSLREAMSGPAPESEIPASEIALKRDFADYVYRLVHDRMFSAQADRALVERVALGMSRSDAKVGLSARRAEMRADVPRMLTEATVPIIAIEPAGEASYDQLVPTAMRHPLRVVAISDTGHFIMLERPAEFQAALEAVLYELN